MLYFFVVIEHKRRAHKFECARLTNSNSVIYELDFNWLLLAGLLLDHDRLCYNFSVHLVFFLSFCIWLLLSSTKASYITVIRIRRWFGSLNVAGAVGFSFSQLDWWLLIETDFDWISSHSLIVYYSSIESHGNMKRWWNECWYFCFFIKHIP